MVALDVADDGVPRLAPGGEGPQAVHPVLGGAEEGLRRGVVQAAARPAARGPHVVVGQVMTDNGPGRRSGEFDEALGSGVRHVYARPYSPWQDGKVERMNQTLACEWQYARARESEASGADAPETLVDHYNWDRPHGACGGLPPMSRIVGVNNVLARNS